MEKANFHELPEEVVNKALEEHEVMDGVRVGISCQIKLELSFIWSEYCPSF